MNALQNRFIASLLTALLVPWLDSKGVKLNDEQVAGLVAAGAIVYHGMAAVGTWTAGLINRVVDKYLPPSTPPTQGDHK